MKRASLAFKEHRLKCWHCSDFDRWTKYGPCPEARRLWFKYMSARLEGRK